MSLKTKTYSVYVTRTFNGLKNDFVGFLYTVVSPISEHRVQGFGVCLLEVSAFWKVLLFKP